MKTTLLFLTLAAALLAGCSGIRSVSHRRLQLRRMAGRPQARHLRLFDRLPSQQAQAADTERLEAAARPALAKAGFSPAAEGAAPDVLVQVGERSTRSDRLLWDDPLWWRGGFGTWRRGPWPGPAWGWSARYDNPRIDSEVAVLLRDPHASQRQALFESQASYESISYADSTAISAMFEAALTDFPRLGINPRRVVVTVAKPQ